MERQKWTDHVFNLGLDPGWATNVISRLQDTSIRLQHYCTSLSNEELKYKPNGAWSIKEHLGHLIDLEPMHKKRLREFVDLKKQLTMADMSNTATEKADHNNETLDDLLLVFNRSRNDLVVEYHNLSEECLLHDSIHPRLKVAMKPVDLLFFVAEHDDHHLASIHKIIQELKN
jgi:uncharacterized damage-inducible protein DinB